MAWYRAGSVTVTNGSPVVTGAGTAFIANVQAGHAINLPDGRAYEVLSVDSNTQISLGSAYLGGTANGQTYSVQPNQGFAQSAATRLSDFLSQVGGWVAGALAGRFGDGNAATPGLSFSADQDTGFRRAGENSLAVVTGGGDRLVVDTTAIYSNLPIRQQLVVEGVGTDIQVSFKSTVRQWNIGQNVGATGSGTLNFYDVTAGIPRLTIDTAGNLLLGVTSGSSHIIAKGQSAGSLILNISGLTEGCANFFAAGGAAPSGAAGAMAISANPTSGRSINAGGTMNASGADYAEYMIKADGCGPIGKGDVCGVDTQGKLTRTWAAAVSFVVKSTDPAYVGGDTWTSHLGVRPTDPGEGPHIPVPPSLAIDATDEDRVAAAAAFRAATQAYATEKVAYDKAAARYSEDLAIWEGALEAARQCVDRIAFAGQVPVNVAGDFAVGDYLVAAPDGDGIQAIAVAATDISFDQYRRRLGKVWAIRDDRPWIDVQHG